MNDSIIRTLLEIEAPRWFAKYSSQGVRVDELTIDDGNSRVDIAILGKRLRAFEIKSASDSLKRLPAQTAAYDQFFDYSTLVVAERHLKNAEDLLPIHWGLVAVSPNITDRSSFLEIRSPQLNRNLNVSSLFTLLWRDEILRLIELQGISSPRYRHFSKDKLIKLLVESVPSELLRENVAKFVGARTGWRDRRPVFRYGD